MHGHRKDENGNVIEVYAEYDRNARQTPRRRKVRGTIHWVDCKTALNAEVRLYDNLFTDPNPDAGDKDFTDYLNPESLEVLKDCKLERSLESAAFPEPYQFLRLGYFCVDNKDSKPGTLVFNRSVSLKDRLRFSNNLIITDRYGYEPYRFSY